MFLHGKSVEEVFAVLDVVQFQRSSFGDRREVDCRISHLKRFVKLLQDGTRVEVDEALRIQIEYEMARHVVWIMIYHDLAQNVDK